MLDYLPLAVFLIAGLLALALWLPRWRMRRAVGRPAPDLQDITCGCAAGPGEDATYFFFSPRCGRCRAVGALVDRLAAQGVRVIKVDVTVTCDVPRRFGIHEVPAVVDVRGGHIARVLVGPQIARFLTALHAPHPAGV